MRRVEELKSLSQSLAGTLSLVHATFPCGIAKISLTSDASTSASDGIESFDRVVLSKEPTEVVDGAMRQPSLREGAEVARNVVELFEAAEVAKPIFDDLLRSIASQVYSPVTLKLADLK